MAWVLHIGLGVAAVVLSIAWARRHPDRALQMWSGRGVAAVCLSVAYLSIVVIALLATLVETKACEDTGARLGYEAVYSVWTDCLVNVDGEWFPLDQVREVKD